MKKPTRRAMLRGAGGALLGLPMLDAMIGNRKGAAQADAVPKRLLVVFRSNGVVPDRWFPGGRSETEFDFATNMAPLERHRRDLLILDGLDMVTAMEDSVGRNPHDLGTCHALTARSLRMGPSGRYGSAGHITDGSAGGPSLDQVVADRIGDATLFPSLTFGVRAGGLPHTPINHAFWRGPFEPISPMQEPDEAFDRIFAPLNAELSQRELEHAHRSRVLDGVTRDLARLRGRLGAEDRARLDAHEAAVVELEERLATQTSAVCSEPAPYAGGAGYRGIGRYHADLAVHALGCDLTRVAAIQWSTGESRVRFSGHPDNHHSLSHGGDSNASVQTDLSEADRFYAEELAYLLDALAARTEADGQRLLDHTVVLFVNEVGKGNNHSKRRLPFLLAGMPSVFQTGRRVRAEGAAHADFFVAVLRGLGFDDETFGVPDLCGGLLPGVLR